MTRHQTLLRRIEAHCLIRGIPVTRFGRQAVNDGHLVRKLRAGKTITLKTLDKIEAMLASRGDPRAARRRRQRRIAMPELAMER